MARAGAGRRVYCLPSHRCVTASAERLPRPHAGTAERLAADTYWCACSRRDIADLIAKEGDGGERRYPGTCRERGLTAGAGRGLRLRVPDEEIAFVDAIEGPQRQTPCRQVGDLLLRDRHGNWTYQFAVTTDDFHHGVTLIIRGRDLLASSGRQIQLARRLGRTEPPAFLHHPLVLDHDRRKLSKRDGSTGIRELRAAGTRPEVVLGRAAYAIGLTASDGSLSAGDLPDLFAVWA